MHLSDGAREREIDRRIGAASAVVWTEERAELKGEALRLPVDL